ncbi:MAG: hypothetical protein DRG78_11220 [Epsilonproteobacteria bacterium]|nr:MAG: hypothetical protein DRG78_11220 [Campylobacterota bacterium]
MKFSKLCKKCLLNKESNEFGKKLSTKDGLNNWCLNCKREYDRIYYLENKEKMNSINESHRVKNKDIRHEYHVNRYAQNKEHFSKLNVINRVKHLSKRKKYRKEYDKTENGKQQYIKDNNKRRELKKSLDNNYNKEDIKYTFKLFNNKCFNCLSTINLEIDHHKPLSG